MKCAPSSKTGATLTLIGLLLWLSPASAFEACLPASATFASSNSTTVQHVTISADKNIVKHSLAVIIYWINQSGNLQRHGQLYPGQNYTVKSYDGHKWVAKDAHNQCQYYTVVAGQWNIFHIKYDEGP